MSEVYYSHTTKLQWVKAGLVPAATIAVAKVNNEIHYGIALCSRGDNFNKAMGRKIAEERLQAGFRKIDIPSDLLALRNDDINNGISEREADRTMCLLFLYSLASSVGVRTKKWKKKITSFNMRNKQNAEVVAKSTKVILNDKVEENA